jgi:hypothetical protein
MNSLTRPVDRSLPDTGGTLSRLRVNVFRVDAATLAARAQGLFATEGLEPEITITSSSTQQMRGLSNKSYDLVNTVGIAGFRWSSEDSRFPSMTEAKPH